jgi:hypothetical protein
MRDVSNNEAVLAVCGIAVLFIGILYLLSFFTA